MKLKPILTTVAVVAALAAGAAVMLAKQSVANTEKTKPAPVASVKPALTVTTTRPTAGDLPITLSANGNIVAWQEASVGAEANGLRLTEVRVNVGDEVTQGQVLAKFAEETIQADVAQARASLAEAEANAQESAANGDRARRLQPTGAISAQQVNQYLTAEQAGKARVQAARATLNAQQLRMKHTQVIAPDSGVISARMATVGAVVGAGTELFRMIRQGRLEWRAEVMSEELGRMAPGAVANLRRKRREDSRQGAHGRADRRSANTGGVGLCGFTERFGRQGRYVRNRAIRAGFLRRIDATAASGGDARRLYLCFRHE